MNSLPLFIFGEVLFDCFPDSEPILGGAPFNVAWHLQGFGEEPLFISAVGDDELGQSIRNAMTEWGMSTEFLQVDPEHPTGMVNVNLQGSEPSYEIQPNCAYDFIHMTPELASYLSNNAMIYHGSLAMRNSVSAESYRQLTENRHHSRFIDVNLRAPWWDRDSVIATLDCAYCVKLNIDELMLLCNADIDPHEEEDLLQAEWLDLASTFKITHNIVNLLVTRGERGATMFDAGGEISFVEVPATSKPVMDTVGAGDAFAAVTLLGLRNDWDVQITLERAQEFASYIVGQRGALSNNAATYRDFKSLWNIF